MLNSIKLWFKLNIMIEVEIKSYPFMGKTDLYLSIFCGGTGVLFIFCMFLYK